MPDGFVTIPCPACGVSLDVHSGRESFRCASCGAISLYAVLQDAIAQVQAETAGVAAELAVMRLKGDLDGVRHNRQELELSGSAGCASCLLILLASGAVIGFAFLSLTAGAVALAGFGVLAAMHRSQKTAARQRKLNRLRNDEARIVQEIDRKLKLLGDGK